MDEPDAEAVDRFERFERALVRIAMKFPEPDMLRLIDDASPMQQLRRNAIINAAINNQRELLVRINVAFPGLDLVDVAEQIRVQVVKDRLDGEGP